MFRLLVAVLLLGMSVSLRSQELTQEPEGSPQQLKVIVRIDAGCDKTKTGMPLKHPAASRYTANLAVRVCDDEDRPVPEASVRFVFPTEGPTAVVANGKGVVVRTDEHGIAKLCDSPPDCQLRANKIGGAFDIDVRAEFFGERGSAQIHGFNDPPPILTRKRLLTFSAIAAAVIIPILALRSNAPHASISVVTPSGPVGAP